jgi:peptidoglycan LD-endopeptidase CwlK|tara:strand:- start:209 stop:676 length:468 start_codon:yes stop_codon:yes gene_type:complete
MSNFKLSQRSLDRIEGIDEELHALVCAAIHNTPYDFGIPHLGGLRTIEEQRKLKESGASKTMKSKHLEGDAFDFMVFLGPRVCWELKFYDDVGDAIVKTARELGIKQLKWGGAWHIDNILDWNGTLLEAHNAYVKLRVDQGRTPFVDMPHFQKGV